MVAVREAALDNSLYNRVLVVPCHAWAGILQALPVDNLEVAVVFSTFLPTCIALDDRQ